MRESKTMNRITRIRLSPEAGHRLVRRQMLAESIDRIEKARRNLRELEERLNGANELARLDFTSLSKIRAQSASLVSISGRLSRRPFGRSNSSKIGEQNA